MSRTRSSAKQAGSRFERQIADTLAHYVDDRIDRRVKTGSKDRGDITGLRHMGNRIVVECKNVTRLQLSDWLQQAEIERGNDDATVGLVIHKRHGKADPLDQHVTMTLRDFIALLTAERPEQD